MSLSAAYALIHAALGCFFDVFVVASGATSKKRLHCAVGVTEAGVHAIGSLLARAARNETWRGGARARGAPAIAVGCHTLMPLILPLCGGGGLRN